MDNVYLPYIKAFNVRKMSFNASKASPVSSSDRIISLDVLRGVAVLGILIMNIQNFSMPSAAYINPSAFGDLSGLNRWVWILSHILASEKFMSTFSLLFGAGVLIFSERAVDKGYNPAILHYRRMAWLLLFGLIHAYLIWSGDILVAYSLCGMLVFVFRKLKPRSLIWIALGLFFIPVLFNVFTALSLPYWPEEQRQEILNIWRPSGEYIKLEIEGMRGNWFDQMNFRASDALFMQTQYFIMATFWRVISLMLLGMALYKSNILSAGRSTGFYTRLALLGFGSGLLLSSLGVYFNQKNGWTMEFSMFLGSEFNFIGSIGTTLAYLAIIMMICKSPGFRRFKSLLSAVGRMAFSNYILQSVLCVFLFYGSGFALYGSIERKYQALFVLGIWMILLIVSALWLKRFRYGPLEWLWRSLTYRKKPRFSNL